MRAPDSVGAGQQFDLSLTVEAEETTPATITVFGDGGIIHSEEVDLRQGANHYTLPLTAGNTGFTDFQVQVTPLTGDGFYQNNQLSAFSRVVGPPRVLLVSSSDEEARYLAQAFADLGQHLVPGPVAAVQHAHEHGAVVAEAVTLPAVDRRGVQSEIRCLKVRPDHSPVAWREGRTQAPQTSPQGQGRPVREQGQEPGEQAVEQELQAVAEGRRCRVGHVQGRAP